MRRGAGYIYVNIGNVNPEGLRPNGSRYGRSSVHGYDDAIRRAGAKRGVWAAHILVELAGEEKQTRKLDSTR